MERRRKRREKESLGNKRIVQNGREIPKGTVIVDINHRRWGRTLPHTLRTSLLQTLVVGWASSRSVFFNGSLGR